MLGDIQNSGILNKFVGNFKKEQTVETQQVLQNNNQTVNNLGKQALGFLNNQKDSKIGQLFQSGQPSVKQILFNVVISTLLKSFFKGELELSNEGATKVLFEQLKNGDKQKKEKTFRGKTKQSKGETNSERIQQCNCQKNFMPVCGENQKTYGNSCLARCEKQNFINGMCSEVDSSFWNKESLNSNQNKQEKKKRKNKKKNRYFSSDETDDTDEEYNQSNSNIQQQNQQQTQVQQVNVTQIGMNSNKGSCSQCPSLYQPICGENNKTYKNICAAECRQIKLKKVGICQLI